MKRFIIWVFKTLFVTILAIISLILLDSTQSFWYLISVLVCLYFFINLVTN